jgi:hypothetical protein
MTLFVIVFSKLVSYLSVHNGGQTAVGETVHKSYRRRENSEMNCIRNKFKNDRTHYNFESLGIAVRKVKLHILIKHYELFTTFEVPTHEHFVRCTED